MRHIDRKLFKENQKLGPKKKGSPGTTVVKMIPFDKERKFSQPSFVLETYSLKFQIEPLDLERQSHDIAKDTPFSDFSILSKGVGVSLASEIFLRAPPSKNFKMHPKIGACGGLPFNSSYRCRVQGVESKTINI